MSMSIEYQCSFHIRILYIIYYIVEFICSLLCRILLLEKDIEYIIFNYVN